MDGPAGRRGGEWSGGGLAAYALSTGGPPSLTSRSRVATVNESYLCKGVRRRAKACEGMGRRAKACEGVRRVWKGVEACAKVCEGMEGGRGVRRAEAVLLRHVEHGEALHVDELP